MHNCVSQIYSALNATNRDLSQITNPFSNIENLVFQGGGIKGIAYLGVLQQLLAEEPNIIKNTKRIAGTSAGSIVALYLALNLDPNTEIKELLSRNYSDLLDDGLTLKVAVNITSWFGSYKYKNFKVRDIVLKSIDYLNDLEKEMKDNPGEGDVEDKIANIFVDILQYYSSKFGSAFGAFMRTIGKNFAKEEAKWLINILRSQSKEEAKVETQIKAPAPITIHEKTKTIVSSTSDHGTTKFEKTVETVHTTESHQKPQIVESTFQNVIDNCYENAFSRVQQPLTGQPGSMVQSTITQEESLVGGHITIQQEKSVEVNDDSVEIVTDVINNAESLGIPSAIAALGIIAQPELDEIKNADVKFYLDQKISPVPDIADASELKGSILHYAIAEMLWFIVLSQLDANGMKQEIGLFSGDIIKEELIEGAILKKFESLGRLYEYKPDFTFKDLASFTDSNGKPLFKPFYICAFNPSLLRTEVFSIEHTPGVIVSEAIRASMSIPVFFKPTTISENGAPRRIYFNNGKNSEEIRYMDGGLLDNYPLWIFDDLKYCVNIRGWAPKRKIVVSNSRTLGFRILDETRIDIYTKPYYGPGLTRMKRVNNKGCESSFGYVMGSMFSADFGEAEENKFINTGNESRSVYVDNLGISPIAFTLSDDDKKRLIESGKQSILNYKIRAKNNFDGEGQ